jgi:hypothetical protein
VGGSAEQRAGVCHDRQRQGVGYTIRGLSPLRIEFGSVTSHSVSMLIGPNYRVRITKQSYRSALGVAHGPLGDGIGLLRKQ